MTSSLKTRRLFPQLNIIIRQTRELFVTLVSAETTLALLGNGKETEKLLQLGRILRDI